VASDPRALKQVLLNLLSNAAKFTPEGGRIVVRARREGEGAVRLEVEDSGIGIAEADQARIFEEFRQLDGSAERQYGGVGLGLAVVRRLADAVGARVTLASEKGKGATFAVRVPREWEEAVEAQVAPLLAPCFKPHAPRFEAHPPSPPPRKQGGGSVSNFACGPTDGELSWDGAPTDGGGDCCAHALGRCGPRLRRPSNCSGSARRSTGSARNRDFRDSACDFPDSPCSRSDSLRHFPRYGAVTLPVQAAVVAIAFIRHTFAVGSHTPIEHCALDVHAVPGVSSGMHVWVAAVSHVPGAMHIAADVHGLPRGSPVAHAAGPPATGAQKLPGWHELTTSGSHAPPDALVGRHVLLVGSQ
jgi:anti-sigma regulatory factor (Ser/Thr protein kinase)